MIEYGILLSKAIGANGSGDSTIYYWVTSFTRDPLLMAIALSVLAIFLVLVLVK